MRSESARRSATCASVAPAMNISRMSRSRAESEVDAKELATAVNYFLSTLGRTERDLFVCRYWFAAPVSELADRFSYSEGRVRTRLSRTRAKLRRFLEKEGLL